MDQRYPKGMVKQSSWSNTEVLQSCCWVLCCRRKWKSWLYKGHHTFFEVSSHFGKDCDAETEAWWSMDFPAVFFQGSVEERFWVACTVFRFTSHGKYLAEIWSKQIVKTKDYQWSAL